MEGSFVVLVVFGIEVRKIGIVPNASSIYSLFAYNL